jgi:hypothetical protein
LSPKNGRVYGSGQRISDDLDFLLSWQGLSGSAQELKHLVVSPLAKPMRMERNGTNETGTLFGGRG